MPRGILYTGPILVLIENDRTTSAPSGEAERGYNRLYSQS